MISFGLIQIIINSLTVTSSNQEVIHWNNFHYLSSGLIYKKIFMQSDLIDLFQSLEDENKVYYLKYEDVKIAKGNICLYHELGGIIDVIWDSERGNMLLATSQDKITSYTKQNTIQIIKGVEFRHAFTCPYIEKEFEKSEKYYKPCACVLLVREDDEHILVTRRKLTLNSFPGAWVLPGGHLDKNQGLIQGGLRQAEEQVGLNIKQAEVLLNHGVMAWQSAFCVNNKIVSSGLVIFFSAKVKKFQVKPQQTEIQEFVWKDAKDHADEHKYTSLKKNGYGQAHLNYLSVYRLNNYEVQETKPWIEQDNVNRTSMKKYE